MLKNIVGYNNPCVGWDLAPASYIGQLAIVLGSYVSIRYATLDITRTRLDGYNQGWRSSFSVFADYAFAVSVSRRLTARTRGTLFLTDRLFVTAGRAAQRHLRDQALPNGGRRSGHAHGARSLRPRLAVPRRFLPTVHPLPVGLHHQQISDC